MSLGQSPAALDVRASPIGSVHVRDHLPMQDAVATWADGRRRGHRRRRRTRAPPALPQRRRCRPRHALRGRGARGGLAPGGPGASSVCRPAVAARSLGRGIHAAWISRRPRARRRAPRSTPASAARRPAHALRHHAARDGRRRRPAGRPSRSATATPSPCASTGEAFRASARRPAARRRHHRARCASPDAARAPCGQRSSTPRTRTSSLAFLCTDGFGSSRVDADGLVAADRRASSSASAAARPDVDRRAAARLARGAGPRRRRRHHHGDPRPQRPAGAGHRACAAAVTGPASAGAAPPR